MGFERSIAREIRAIRRNQRMTLGADAYGGYGGEPAQPWCPGPGPTAAELVDRHREEIVRQLVGIGAENTGFADWPEMAQKAFEAACVLYPDVEELADASAS